MEIAAKRIKSCDALLITTGAGMGIDSGLPDFRGKEGLWKAYPFFKDTGMSFTDAASHQFFEDDPHKFWFFYGHRYNTYKETTSHEGYTILKEIAETHFNSNYFCMTSNVDGHFLKSGFAPEKIYEVHGSLMHFQCYDCFSIQPREETSIPLDLTSHTCPTIPTCYLCGENVRPNVLFFGDYYWISTRSDEQSQLMDAWMQSIMFKG